MNEMKLYPAYKSSNIEWLGDIPEHWRLERMGTLFNERRKKVSDTDFMPLSVTKNGIVPQLDSAAKSNDGDNRKQVKVGDFVINSRSDRKGSSGLSNLEGSVSLINIVLRITTLMHRRYSEYLLKSNDFIEEFYRIGHGIVDDLWTTRFDDSKNLRLPCPPLEEQQAIAQYLDQKTAQIERFIANKTRLIALLKEEKTAYISELMQEAAQRYESKKLKYVFRLSRGVDLSGDKFKEGIFPVYGSNGIIGYHDQYTTKAPCVTVGRSGSVGEVNFVNQDFWAHNTALYVYRAKQNNMTYIYYLLLHLDLKSLAAGSAVGTLNRNYIHELQIPSPPLAEQEAIVTKIQTKHGQIDAVIIRIQKEIDLMKEYKTALISEAVTGKIKVV